METFDLYNQVSIPLVDIFIVSLADAVFILLELTIY